VIGPAAFVVLRDVHTKKPDLAILDCGIPVDKGCTSSPKGFHLSAGKDDATFKGIDDEIIESSLLILSDEFGALFPHGAPQLPRDLGELGA
jgi:hypothetical protein